MPQNDGRRRTSSRSTRRRTPLRRRRSTWIVLGLVVVGLAIVGVLLARDISTARTALDDATTQAERLQQQLTSGDTDGAKASLAGLQDSTQTAVDSTSGPLWSVASVVPYVGRNVDAVQVSARSVDDIADRALPPLVSTSRAIDADLFKPRAGRFDLKAFTSIRKPVTTSADVLTENRERLDAIDPDQLLSSVRGPVKDLQGKVASAQQASSAAARALRLAPELLGGDGRRTYLLLFQNNAEARTTGGIPGAMAIVRANQGRLSFDTDFSKDDVKIFAKPVVRLTKDERTTFGTTIGTDVRDINLLPSFPRSASIARTMVQRSTGTKVDGVISLDPVALSYALRGTGAVRVGGDTRLTSENAVEILLNQVYARYEDPAAQDAFFADAARRIFTQVLDGRGDPRKVLSGLDQAVQEHRILMWFPRESEQAEIEPTALSGRLRADGTSPRVGVFVNDATSSKMQYYLRQTASVDARSCSADGRQRLTTTATFRSTAPADAAQLPSYIAGTGKHSRVGTQRIGVQLALPAGSDVARLTINGKRRLVSESSFGGRPFVRLALVLKPGQDITVVVDSTTGRDQRGRPVLDVTPGVTKSPGTRRFASACGS